MITPSITNVLKIPSATPNEKDAAQYMIRHGKMHYNLCGELSVMYCMQDEAHTDNADEFLDYWQVKNPPFYKSLFPNWTARTTGASDLKRMIEMYQDVAPPMLLNKLPFDPYVWEDTLKEYQAIIGVQIDNWGYLVGSGIGHWIVLEEMQVTNKNHSLCIIYNPYTNSMEQYKWRELMNSTWRQGLWVKR
jgi:hypothetical protein